MYTYLLRMGKLNELLYVMICYSALVGFIRLDHIKLTYSIIFDLQK